MVRAGREAVAGERLEVLLHDHLEPAREHVEMLQLQIPLHLGALKSVLLRRDSTSVRAKADACDRGAERRAVRRPSRNPRALAARLPEESRGREGF